MPVIIPIGYMHVIQPIQLLNAPKPYSVTYGIKPDGGDPFQIWPNPTVQDAIDECQDVWLSSFQAFFDTNATLGPAVGYYRPAAGRLDLYTAEDAPVAGTRAVTGTPPNCAAVVRKRTSSVGKARRGRCFFPCMLDETNVSETGVLTPSFVNTLQAKADLWLSGLSAKPAIHHMALLHSSDLLDPDEVTRLLVQPIVRTQRRRLQRG